MNKTHSTFISQMSVTEFKHNKSLLFSMGNPFTAVNFVLLVDKKLFDMAYENRDVLEDEDPKKPEEIFSSFTS